MHIQRLSECRADSIGKGSNGIVEDQQILLLILGESMSEVSQDWLEERNKVGPGLFFKGSEGTTTCFLDLFVGVEYSS